ncbi:MAG TPA: 2-hydroxyacid dehydrogenase [Fibrobacteria bacterium]|nr:2-hydroxyacid dehydrogenase [Fibrobacteria bacterium]
MKIAMFSTKPWVHQAFDPLVASFHADITWLEPRLEPATATLAAGHEVACVFVNDQIDATVLARMKDVGVGLVALRCAGFNNVDLKAASRLGIGVVRVPAYSPYAVAEHAVGLMLCLNRRFHRAWSRVLEGNFTLDGLLGFDLRGKTVGVVGTGKIGQVVCGILNGFGCRILAYDTYPNAVLAATGVEYVDLSTLYAQSDILTLHCPLTPETRHLIDAESLDAMRNGVMIINTSRGPLIDTAAVIAALKSGKIGYLGLDVYEEEHGLFFEDHSQEVIQDDVFVRLQTFPNVLITAHQAFFTKEAVDNIAHTTMANIREYLETGTSGNRVD